MTRANLKKITSDQGNLLYCQVDSPDGRYTQIMPSYDGGYLLGQGHSRGHIKLTDEEIPLVMEAITLIRQRKTKQL